MRRPAGWRVIARSNPPGADRPSHVLIDVGDGQVRVLDVVGRQLMPPRPIEVEQVRGRWFRADPDLTPALDSLLEDAVDTGSVRVRTPQLEVAVWRRGSAWSRGKVDNGWLRHPVRPLRELLATHLDHRQGRLGRPRLVFSAVGDLGRLVPLLNDLFAIPEDEKRNLRGTVRVLLDAPANPGDRDRLAAAIPSGLRVWCGQFGAVDGALRSDTADLVLLAGDVAKAPGDLWAGRCAALLLDSSARSALDTAKRLQHSHGSAVFIAGGDVEAGSVATLALSPETASESDRLDVFIAAYRHCVGRLNIGPRQAKESMERFTDYAACLALAMGLSARNVELSLGESEPGSIDIVHKVKSHSEAA